MFFAGKDGPEHGDRLDDDVECLESDEIGRDPRRQAGSGFAFGNQCGRLMGRIRIENRDVGTSSEMGDQVLRRRVAGNRDVIVEGSDEKAPIGRSACEM